MAPLLGIRTGPFGFPWSQNTKETCLKRLLKAQQARVEALCAKYENMFTAIAHKKQVSKNIRREAVPVEAPLFVPMSYARN